MRLHLTVPAYHAAVVSAATPRTLGSGRHWFVRGPVQVVDLREQLISLAPQEIPLADGIVVRIGAALTYRVSDPADYLGSAHDPVSLVYLAVQLALRTALADFTSETVLTAVRGRELEQQVTAAAEVEATRLGLQIVRVAVKDVGLPAELRSAAAALVTARQHGLAKLERARAETAALRALSNAARMLDEHPALARLRLVESAPLGAQVVLRFDTPDTVD